MEVRFTNNLNLWNESWPTHLPAIPNVGDKVESATCHHTSRFGDFRLVLKVVSVTWKYNVNTYGWIPCIRLHNKKTFVFYHKSIKEFYEWYALRIGKDVSYFI